MNFSYIIDITLLNTVDKVKITFNPIFSSKMADLAVNVRMKGPKKQATVS